MESRSTFRFVVAIIGVEEEEDPAARATERASPARSSDIHLRESRPAASTMFALASLVRLRAPATPLAATGARLFSTSNFLLAGYKLKSHQGAKKRWKAIASGVFKRVSSLSAGAVRLTYGSRLLGEGRTPPLERVKTCREEESSWTNRVLKSFANCEAEKASAMGIVLSTEGLGVELTCGGSSTSTHNHYMLAAS